jgi:hypothetical protein
MNELCLGARFGFLRSSIVLEIQALAGGTIIQPARTVSLRAANKLTCNRRAYEANAGNKMILPSD